MYQFNAYQFYLIIGFSLIPQDIQIHFFNSGGNFSQCQSVWKGTFDSILLLAGLNAVEHFATIYTREIITPPLNCFNV